MVKFIVTSELGRLTKWLRLLGFDVVFYKSQNLSALIISAIRESRIILTRDTKVPLGRGAKVIRINSDFLKEQIVQVTKNLAFSPDEKLMFTRCIICNELLEDIKKDSVKDLVPEYVFKTQERFVSCPVCHKIYWTGTHWGNAKKYLAEICES